MEKYLITFVVLGVVSFLYLKLAIKYRIIDKPNERSSHSKITVRGGGIIFPIAILLFFFFNNYEYPFFTIGVVLISIISFLDDIFTLSAKVRFPIQFVAVFLILFQIDFPFEPIYIFALLLLFGVGIVNMFNFMDGINGITGLYAMSVLLGFYFINDIEAIVNSELILFSFISLVVFGFYNFRKKALFFAGDIGSIVIGMLIFFLGIFFTIELVTPLVLALVIVYGGDATMTLLYRKIYTNENIFDPHRHHIYQKIIDVYNVSHLKVAFAYALIQLIVNFIVYKTYNLEFITQFTVFFILVIFFMIIYVLLFRMIRKKELFKNDN